MEEEEKEYVEWLWDSNNQNDKEKWANAYEIFKTFQNAPNFELFSTPIKADQFYSQISGGSRPIFEKNFEDPYTLQKIRKNRLKWQNVPENWLSFEHITKKLLPYIISLVLEGFQYFSTHQLEVLAPFSDFSEKTIKITRKKILFVNSFAFFNLLKEKEVVNKFTNKKIRCFNRLYFSTILSHFPSLFCILHYFAFSLSLVCFSLFISFYFFSYYFFIV